MKKYFSQVYYFLFWIIFFVSGKGIFLWYHHSKTSGLTNAEIVKVFLYGLRMDISAAAYICIFPFLLIIFQKFFTRKINYAKIISVYTIVVILLFSFLTVADLELYNAWGFRLDSTPLQYFSTPKEMIASSSSAPIFLLLFIFAVLSIFFIWLFLRFFKINFSNNNSSRKTANLILSFFCLTVLIIPIRGGLQQIPLLQSDVYFSKKLFANHAAINVVWNVTASLLNKVSATKNPYNYFNNATAQIYFDSLYATSDSNFPLILTTQKPNIIIIILESYTTKLVGCLGGEQGVTPHLDSIAKEGMLFTNIYASGDRSEKGLVAILSGYPAQNPSIIKTPRKTEDLPNITKTLGRQGYHSSYYYGGEPEFANIKSYLLNSGFDRIVSKSNFSSKDYNSKWGVHDHILFSRFLDDLRNEKQPFFSTLFTLSSHEPYDVPMETKFPGKDEFSKFKNSFYYTDQSLGSFIDEAKKQKWWDSTLIILVADHGHRLPDGFGNNDLPSKFKIPLIFTGGALKTKGVINKTIGSQTDITKTILQQLQLSSADYQWGKNLLDTSARQFAFYNFVDGFGFVTPAGTATFDNVSKQVINKYGVVDSQLINNGKAYMQLSYKNYLSR